MIRSYGLHWKAEHVNWGSPGAGNAGALLGAASRGSQAHSVDFRDQRGIYALYSDYELVYVGQTGAGQNRLLNRLRTHLNGPLSERWNRFSWFGTQNVTRQHRLHADIAAVHVSLDAALNILEAVSIAISEPRLNRQSGRWGNATQYFQFLHNDEHDQEEDDAKPA